MSHTEPHVCSARLLPAEQNTLKTLKSNRLRAAYLKGFEWPAYSNIRIYIGSGGENVDRYSKENVASGRPYDPFEADADDYTVKDNIIRIVQERIQPLVNLQISFVDNVLDANIRISFDTTDGAWSYIGNQNEQIPYPSATMNLGWFDVATVIHEFGHMLGMIHEHQNPKDNKIQWNDDYVIESMSNVWSEELVRRNILDSYDEDQVNGSVYDPKSIMLYYFPAAFTLNGIGTEQNLRLSPKDAKWLSKTYFDSNNPTVADFYLDVYGVNIATSTTGDTSGGTSSDTSGNTSGNKTTTSTSTTKNSHNYFLIAILGVLIAIFLILTIPQLKKTGNSFKKKING